MWKIDGLLCRTLSLRSENRRQVVGVEDAVQPVEVPVPPTVEPVQVQDVAVAVRVPKDRAVEVDEPGVSTNRFLPQRRNQMLVLPEVPERPGIEADVSGLRQTLLLLFAVDGRFALLEHVNQRNLGEVKRGDCHRAFVLFVDLPSFADELGRIEGDRAVDGDDLRFPDDQLPAVLEEHGELLTSLTVLVVDDRLQGIDRNLCPVDFRCQGKQSLDPLFNTDGFAHDELPSFLFLVASLSITW